MTESEYFGGKEVFSPNEVNLGKNCRWWMRDPQIPGCGYPKFNLAGRTSCEGMIDDVCLYLLKGRRPKSLTQEQKFEIQSRVPDFQSNRSLPPGDTIK